MITPKDSYGKEKFNFLRSADKISSCMNFLESELQFNFQEVFALVKTT